MNDFLNAYSYFYIYAFIGWCIEVIYSGVMKNRFVNRGFLNGPLCPVYGLGFYGITLLLKPVIGNFTELFLGSMLITTAIELVAGFILYKAFGLRWWDYSENKLNLGGFICLRFSIYWGIAGSFAMLTVHPMVSALVTGVPKIVKLMLLGIMTIVFVLDLVATILAVLKLKEKIRLVNEASEEIRALSNRIGIRIYDHVEPVVKRTAPVIEGYGEIRELYNKNRSEERQLYLTHRAEEKALYDKLMAQEKSELEQDRLRLMDKINSTINSINRREHSVMNRITDYDEHRNLIRRIISNRTSEITREETNKENE